MKRFFLNWPLREYISDDYKLKVGLTVIFATYPHKLCVILRSAPTRQNNSETVPRIDLGSCIGMDISITLKKNVKDSEKKKTKKQCNY